MGLIIPTSAPRQNQILRPNQLRQQSQAIKELMERMLMNQDLRLMLLFPSKTIESRQKALHAKPRELRYLNPLSNPPLSKKINQST